MDKAKKRRIKKILSWLCIGLLTLGLALMPLAAGSGAEGEGPKASILSGSVEYRDITTGIHGGGTLSVADPVEVKLPSGVKITQFLVNNGDAVAQGDALAAVDRVSVMSAITQVQNTLEHLVEEMDDVADAEAPNKITAQAGGRVKLVYGQLGETVQEVMLRDGALAVLSLDGLMAVDIPCVSGLSTGDLVKVTPSDGSTVSGRVESNLDGILVITVEDQGYAPGTEVAVTDLAGSSIGSGELYVHNAWRATAYTGTISRVNIKAEDTVSPGRTLFTLTDTVYLAERNSLANVHREYEALMLDLFQMYQSCFITAPCGGIVSGVDLDSAHLLSGSQGWTLSLLANAPNGDDETSYINFAGMVTGIDGGIWELSLNPNSFPVSDYKDLSAVPLERNSMTQPVSYVPTVPVYTLAGGEWQQIRPQEIRVGDILLFAGDAQGEFVWSVLVSREETAPEEPGPVNPSEPTAPSEPEEPQPTDPEVDTGPTLPGGMGDLIQGGMQIPGGFGGIMGGSAPQEPEFEYFELEGDALMTITSGESMILNILVDEQDISSLQPGLSAQIRMDALRGQDFGAVVTSVGRTGSNNGGSSKFSVELTLPRSAEMLAGMSARAFLPLLTAEQVLTVPVEALVELGSRTVIYTSMDENGALCGPVEVTVGISDGHHAQILSGLTAGDGFYYSYYDTLELSNEVEQENSFSFG